MNTSFIPYDLFLPVPFPQWVWKLSLSPGAKLTYIFLCQSAYKKNHCWPSQKLIAEAVNASVRSVQNYLKELSDEGLIEIEVRGKERRADDAGIIYRLLYQDRLLGLIPKERLERLARRANNPNTKNLRADHANISSSYREQESFGKSLRKPSSLCPEDFHPAEQAVPPEGVAGACSFPPGQNGEKGRDYSRRSPEREFEQLWQAWPVKQEYHPARNIFLSLFRRKLLPDLPALLGIVEAHKERDSRWKRGKMQNLSNWLADMRWTDEPYTEPGEPAPQNSAMPADPATVAARKASEAAIVEAMEQKMTSAALPDLPSEAASAVDEILAIWPVRTSRALVTGLARNLAASGRLAELLAEARRFIASSPPQVPNLGTWLYSAQSMRSA